MCLSKLRNMLCREQPIREYPALEITGAEASSALPDCNKMMWDGRYFVPSMEDGAEIIADICLNMPSYVSDVFDCDNYALLATGRVAERFRVNSCGIAINYTMAHAYNIFICHDEGVLIPTIFEPQTGEIEPGDSYHNIDTIIMG